MSRIRRLFVFVGLIGALLVSSVAPLSAADRSQEAPQSYIVVMAADPVIAYEGEIADLPATKPPKGNKVNPNSAHVRKYQAWLAAQHDASLAEAGASTGQKINDYSMALNGYSALLTTEQVSELRAQKDVVLVLEDELHFPDTDSSPAYLGLTGAGGAWQAGYDGRGIVLGIIDTGIWPEHPSFADDGSYPPPPTGPLPCEFGNTTDNPDDAPFTCNNKLIGAYQMLATYRASLGATPDEFNSARDDSGHGTHTASTAGGNAGVAATVLGLPRGTISGIAPRAHIIAYKGLGNAGGFTSDLVAAINQAVADGVDVINYSIGGGASLTGGDDIAFLFAANAGVFVASSAGNSGPGAGTIGGPGSVPWLTTVGANTQSRFIQGTVVLGNGASYTGASITAGVGPAPLIDAASVGNNLCDPAVPFSGSVAGAVVLCQRGVVGRVAKSLAVSTAGGVGMIMYETSDAGNLFSDTHFIPTVHIDNTPGLAIKAYAATPGATAQIIGEQTSTWAAAPSMTDFSSRGPNVVAEDIIKPDITAPGIQILAGNSPFPDPGAVTGDLFQAIAGTSMSSPHIAGLYALIKQAHPEWSPAMAKSALMTTAHQNVVSNDRTSPATPFEMGAGHANPGKPNQKGSAFQPGLVYDAGLNEYFGFLCDADPAIFVNPAGTCGSLAGAGVPTDAFNLNLASIGVSQLAGSQTVVRTVTSVAKENGNRKYTVSVNAPPGYSVTVSPSNFTLKSGQSATYQVTITNVSAPIGEWRFGSLTWNDQTGHYKAYSPIAVRGAKFDAPAEISGEGESGSASFNVKFGYTGAYAATGHGLQAATLTVDNVAQDPNQSFNPGDGFSDQHTIPVAGALFLRVAIPPEATEAGADLDVYLFNPGGALVASSGLPGTNEEISIPNPADGNWTVFVHGWLAPGGDSDYTLYSWVLSNTPGGNMTVTGPAAATIGTTGTINVNWTGAALGQWHLGAVAHRDGASLMGTTLVEVDNR